jgi:hypothetical protein
LILSAPLAQKTAAEQTQTATQTRAHLPSDVTMYSASPALLNLKTPPSSPNGHSNSLRHLLTSLLLLLASIHWLVLQLPRAADLNNSSRSAALLLLLLDVLEAASVVIADALLLLLLFDLLRLLDVGSSLMRT